MKKIIIIFIIVCALLSFMEISYLAQESNIFNYGEFWNSFPEKYYKGIYIRGFRDGIWKCLDELVSLTSQDSEMRMAVRKMFDLYEFICGHYEAVQTVMDDLYKDPANTYIQFSSMCEIACQKLKGEDIEPLLRKARKKALP